ncbi:GroES-like protein [Viridothelium virens]|uniref:GroES-like protein n=1 Tax=Viridothelium virens TaxID=1048519 RepID=A0A6A6H7A3_VIRVR|nr:GroES-like protein [Viridothelium virens]
MRALQLTRPSPTQPPNLFLVTLPTPTPSTTHLLIRITASYINPSDLLNRKGGFPYTTFPRVPGRDFAGTIEAAPPSSSSTSSPAFKPGDRVFGTSGSVLSFTADGAHAEYLLAPASGLVATPAALTDAQAAMVGTPYATAAQAVGAARVREGETVLVLGASGAVGSAAVQIAEAAGARVLRGARGAEGRDAVDLARDAGLSGVVGELTAGKGVDVVVNTVGDVALQEAALGVLALRGRLSFISAPRGESDEFSFHLTSFYRKGLSIIGINSLMMTLEEGAQSLKELVPLFEQGKLRVLGEEKLTKVSLEQAVDAYEDMGKGSRKKYLILNQE